MSIKPLKPQRLALAATKIRNKVYAVGRITVDRGVVLIRSVKVKAGAATYIGQEPDAIFWLTSHGLNPIEAKAFVREGLEQFDERDSIERAANALGEKN